MVAAGSWVASAVPDVWVVAVPPVLPVEPDPVEPVVVPASGCVEPFPEPLEAVLEPASAGDEPALVGPTEAPASAEAEVEWPGTVAPLELEQPAAVGSATQTPGAPGAQATARTERARPAAGKRLRVRELSMRRSFLFVRSACFALRSTPSAQVRCSESVAVRRLGGWARGIRHLCGGTDHARSAVSVVKDPMCAKTLSSRCFSHRESTNPPDWAGDCACWPTNELIAQIFQISPSGQ